MLHREVEGGKGRQSTRGIINYHVTIDDIDGHWVVAL